MVIEIKPVTIVGNSIAESVGLKGKNKPDDILTIKKLLNGIAPENGGADGTLDESDLSDSDDSMDPLIVAIFVFQRAQPGLLHDGRVDPEKNTIKRMRAFFKKSKGGGVEVPLTIQPDGPIFGPCDARGFSAAKLRHDGENWSGFDGSAPIRQMVPVGQTRTLRVKGTGGTAVFFQLDSPKAVIIDSTSDTVTISGRVEGEADLIVKIEGQRPTFVRLLVRGVSSIPIDVVHLGRAPLANGLMIATQRSVAGGITRIFGSQANLTFTSGTSKIVETVMTEGRLITIDPAKNLSIRSATAGPQRAEQEFRFGDLKQHVSNGRAVTMFISAKIIDDEDPSVLGRGSPGERMLWFNPMKGGFNTALVPAHEVGHSLGMDHITAPRNELFLMHRNTQPNNIIIPCETLVQLKP